MAAAAAASSSIPTIGTSTRTGTERFYVELKDGETTFVSWRKLQKDSCNPHPHHQTSSLSPPVGAHPALEARFAPPEVVKEKDVLPPPPNRFNSMIERIERLYQGGDSDDELSDGLDDDKYDTRDSFIDDSELNDYFSVENAKLKHDGFFVNRGTLQQEPELCPVAVQKKRKKAIKKLDEESNKDGRQKANSGSRTKPKTCSPSFALASSNSNKGKLCLKPSDPAKKMSGGKEVLGTMKDRSIVDSVSDIDTKDQGSKLLDVNEPLESDSFLMEHKDMLKKLSKPVTVQKVIKEDNSKETMKSSSIMGREFSPAHTKGTTLEKAFLELEKGVAELCPPSVVARDPEHGKRNRLPLDIKQKLTKVARLAAKQGRIADEQIERLMGILGHMMRVKTLKRNLKAMVEMGLSAIHEKEGRLRGIKEEVIEMIRSRVRSLQAQDACKSEDLQANGEGRYNWDHATEDKICDLYEQYIEGMDENKGPHLRKLYAELVELWPNGWMDNIGIKLALRRAKDRKRRLEKACNSSEGKRRRAALKPRMESSDTNREPILQSSAPVHDKSLLGKTSRSALEQRHMDIEYEQSVEAKYNGSPGSIDKNHKGMVPTKKKVNRETDKSCTIGITVSSEIAMEIKNGVDIADKSGFARADKSNSGRDDKSSVTVVDISGISTREKGSIVMADQSGNVMAQKKGIAVERAQKNDIPKVTAQKIGISLDAAQKSSIMMLTAHRSSLVATQKKGNVETAHKSITTMTTAHESGVVTAQKSAITSGTTQGSVFAMSMGHKSGGAKAKRSEATKVTSHKSGLELAQKRIIAIGADEKATVKNVNVLDEKSPIGVADNAFVPDTFVLNNFSMHEESSGFTKVPLAPIVHSYNNRIIN